MIIRNMFIAVAVTDVVVLSLAVYLFPVLIGRFRRVPHIGALAAINVLLGWTLFGWVVALALALRSVNSTRPLVQILQDFRPGRPRATPRQAGRVPPGWAGQPGAQEPGAQEPGLQPPPLVLPRRPVGYGEAAGSADPGNWG
jgi:hypothetical protein